MKTPPTGPELKKLREAANVSAAVVAKAAGLSDVALFFFESGRTDKPRKLDAILAAYDQLDTLPKKSAGGRPRLVKEKAVKLKRKPRSVKQKRPPVKRIDPDREADAGLDDCMKSRLIKTPGRSECPASPNIRRGRLSSPRKVRSANSGGSSPYVVERIRSES
jgi:transcriptional regulator with XRE-family HTH domain